MTALFTSKHARPHISTSQRQKSASKQDLSQTENLKQALPSLVVPVPLHQDIQVPQ